MGERAVKSERLGKYDVPEARRLQFVAAEAGPIDLSVEHVLSLARARTGLTDFGPVDFQQRLQRLLSEVEADSNVWKAAKAIFMDPCVRSAANRLRNQDFLARHPKVHDLVIERPIIIVGLFRSGTTHLLNLIAADRRTRYLPVYLGAEPTPLPGEKPGPDGRDPRWHRANERWEYMQKASPIAAIMHNHSPDHACGDTELQMADFASYHWEAVANVPNWRDYYLKTDQTPHYEYARTILKAVAYQQPDQRRWILKGIQNSEQLPALAKVFPDATILMTHRDPIAIVQSVLTMSAVLIAARQKTPDFAANTIYWIDRVEHMLRAYMRDMDVIPKARRLDILFHEFMADDVRTAQRILEVAGLPVTPESNEDLSNYMKEHARYKAGRVIYDLQGDFGVDVGMLRERFRFYTDYFGIEREV